MNVLAAPLRMTAEEFEKLSDTTGLELLDGRLKGKNIGTESGAISSRMAYFLWSVVLPAELGEVMDGDGTYRCFPNRPNQVRKPDVSFIRKERLPNGEVPRGITNVRPDLAVEVVSPNDEYDLVDEKVADYYSVGVPLVWVVSPATRTVLVYLPDGTVRRLTEADELTAGPVTPGFRVTVAHLFPKRAAPAAAPPHEPLAPAE